MPRRAIGAAQPAAQPAQPAAHPAAQQPPDHLPSPPGLTFNTVVVQPEGTNGLTVPKFLLPDGRNGRRPLVTFVPQRFVEIVLFNRFDGGSSGAVYKILNLNGLGPTAWTINTAAVVYNELSQAHATFIFDRYKEHLPTNGDPVLANRMRNVTLLPIATVAAVCRIRGRSPGTTAFLRACAPNQLPRSWEIEEEAETLEDNEHDLILVDRLQEAEDAEADVAPSFEAELRAGSFSSFNQKAADEKTARAYALTPAQLGAKIKKEADVYIAFRVSPLEARRASTAVAETTTQADLQSYYRFLGYLRLKQLLPLDVHPSFEVLLHPSAPHWVAGYVDFMKGERGLAFSSMANYINSLFGLATYVFDSDDFDSDSAAGANHTVLDALVNLRSQCESLAKEAGLYAEKRGGWMKWEDAQKARVKCLERLQAYTDTDVHFRKQLLMDAIVITIFTYGPVDRVGVVRAAVSRARPAALTTPAQPSCNLCRRMRRSASCASTTRSCAAPTARTASTLPRPCARTSPQSITAAPSTSCLPSRGRSSTSSAGARSLTCSRATSTTFSTTCARATRCGP